MKADIDIQADARGMRVAIAASAYHADVTSSMVRAAREEFARLGGDPSGMRLVEAAGAFELPLLVDALLARPDVDGAVAIGCVVRGETVHDRHLGQAVTQELLSIAVRRGRPVGLAVLTVEDVAQAHARAGGALGNKGSEAMLAAVATCNAAASLAPAGAGAAR
jgi:6,7-dimethyl-8-ribityllumazine synthase